MAKWAASRIPGRPEAERKQQVGVSQGKTCSICIEAKVETELDRLEETEVLREVAVSDWASPVVVVLKANGTMSISV